MKRQFKVWYPTHSGPLPERSVLERAAARELLTHWELTKNKAAVDAMLAKMDKIYGKGAQDRIRQHMRNVARYERHA